MSSHDHSYHTLGKFTPDAEISMSMKEEELKAAYVRIAQLEHMVSECVDYFEGCSVGWPAPNREMMMLQRLEEVIS